jgi:hypothetical protein
MRIRMKDGRVFGGTALQIVRSMQDVAFNAETFTLTEYIAWVVQNASDIEGVDLDVRGTAESDRAESLVRELVRARLAGRA